MSTSAVPSLARSLQPSLPPASSTLAVISGTILVPSPASCLYPSPASCPDPSPASCPDPSPASSLDPYLASPLDPSPASPLESPTSQLDLSLPLTTFAIISGVILGRSLAGDSQHLSTFAKISGIIGLFIAAAACIHIDKIFVYVRRRRQAPKKIPSHVRRAERIRERLIPHLPALGKLCRLGDVEVGGISGAADV